ncbi:MAG: peptidylprolyl isomerase [Deltaproteobacteria bacterium]|nr:peptidylprolyl isomerase [Deltaproteobacteria bacterium]
MWKYLSFIICFCFMFFGTPVLNASQTIIARVNKTTLTLDELNKKFKESLKYYQFKAPTKETLLDDLVKRELGIQEAKRLNLDKDPDIIDRINTVLYHALIEKQLTAEFEKIQITDEEAKAFYTINPEIRTSHIFVALPPSASQEEIKKAKTKIQAIYDDHLKDGKMSFSEVAQRYSEGIAAPQGGDIDYQTRDRLDPVYYEAALKLKVPGKISPIIKTQFGLHIIKLTSIKPWEDTDKIQIKRILFDEKRSKIFEKYMSELKTKANIVVHQELIK